MKATWLCLIGGAAMCAPWIGRAQLYQNLLTNPGAEDGDLSGWTITEGGDPNPSGWLATNPGDNPGAHSGDYCFATSYVWDVRYQIVDLLAAGFTADELDAAPPIVFSEWTATRNDPDPYKGGKYFMRFALLDENQDPANPIAEYSIGSKDSPIELGRATAWFENRRTFSNYGSGVRYLYFEDGGIDRNYWAGHYGTHFDDASVMVVPEPSAFALVGGLALLAGAVGRRFTASGNPKRGRAR